MKVSPKVSKLITDNDTKDDKLVHELFLQIKLNYFEQMQNLARLKINEELELIHYFIIYILKEDECYRVITYRSHMHEVYKNCLHYGDVFLINENLPHKNSRNNLSVYDDIAMDKLYKTLDINKVIFDFNQIFKNVEDEKISLEIRTL